MRKVIDGKIYDTKTAEEIATDKYRDGNNEYPDGISMSLYKTKKGNYFSRSKNNNLA
jgi:hypothetical protein